MKTRTSLSLLLLVLASISSVAQQGKPENNQPKTKEASMIASILDFNAWLNKLNGAFSDIVAEEKRNQCIRRLGYLGADIDAVIKQKQDIILLTKGGKDATSKKSGLSPMVDDLRNSISNLTTLLNDVYGEDGSNLAQRLRDELIYEKSQLAEQIVDAQKSEEVIKAAEEGIRLMRESSTLVWQLRAKLQSL
jgi:hypothetical protein